jgi:hypothetical protein
MRPALSPAAATPFVGPEATAEEVPGRSASLTSMSTPPSCGSPRASPSGASPSCSPAMRVSAAASYAPSSGSTAPSSAGRFMCSGRCGKSRSAGRRTARRGSCR